MKPYADYAQLLKSPCIEADGWWSTHWSHGLTLPKNGKCPGGQSSVLAAGQPQSQRDFLNDKGPTSGRKGKNVEQRGVRYSGASGKGRLQLGRALGERRHRLRHVGVRHAAELCLELHAGALRLVEIGADAIFSLPIERELAIHIG